MIIKFSVENHRSILERQTLDFAASRFASHPDVPFKHERFKYGVLPAIAIYGPNGAGKTNLLRAMEFFSNAVEYSHNRWKPEAEIECKPHFSATNQPSLFECEFELNNEPLRYGFKLDCRQILEEWLYVGRRKYFTRKLNELAFGELFTGAKKSLEVHLRQNSLFLSTAAQNNQILLKEIQSWISDWKIVIGNRLREQFAAAHFVGLPWARSFFVKALSVLDPTITNIERPEASEPKLFPFQPTDSKLLPFIEGARNWMDIVITRRTGTTNSTLKILDESAGTQAYIQLVAVIVVTLQNGGQLLIDELDNSLHPSIVRAIVSLFQSKEANHNGAQLLFTTHDTTILDAGVLRPDQVWFTERLPNAGTKLYSLADFEGVRSDWKSQRAYLEGRFGAVPLTEDHLKVFAAEINRPDHVRDHDAGPEDPPPSEVSHRAL